MKIVKWFENRASKTFFTVVSSPAEDMDRTDRIL